MNNDRAVVDVTVEDLRQQAIWDVNSALQAGREDWAAEISAAYAKQLGDVRQAGGEHRAA